MKPLTEEYIWEVLDLVKDPEIPVLSVKQLGIVKAVRVDGEAVEVDIVPTFAGCPAIEVMRKDIEKRCLEAGASAVTVHVKFKEAWTTNRISPKGRQQLKQFGISPPPAFDGDLSLEVLSQVECPKCGSTDTHLLNSFGPTACRAIHHCKSCHETFEQMKPL